MAEEASIFWSERMSCCSELLAAAFNHFENADGGGVMHDGSTLPRAFPRVVMIDSSSQVLS